MNGWAKGILLGSMIGAAAMTAISATSPRTMRRIGRDAVRMKQDMTRKFGGMLMGK